MYKHRPYEFHLLRYSQVPNTVGIYQLIPDEHGPGDKVNTQGLSMDMVEGAIWLEEYMYSFYSSAFSCPFIQCWPLLSFARASSSN